MSVFSWKNSFFLLVLVAWASTADAARKKAVKPLTNEQELAKAESAYDDYKYDRSITVLQSLLDKQPTDAKVRQRARLLLAFSYYFKRDELSAQAALKNLFRENVDYQVDREMHHPDLARFYDTEYRAYVSSLVLKPAEAQQLPQASSTTTIVAAPDQTSSVSIPREVEGRKTIGDDHPWVRIFPGGIGHFLNHDFVGGGIFLGLEVVLIGMNVTAAILRPTLRAGAVYRPPAVELQYVQNIGAIGAIVVAVVSIVDAFVWSPARGRKSLNAMPSTVDLGPLGAYNLVLSPILY